MPKNNFKETRNDTITQFDYRPFLSIGNTEVTPGTLQPCETTVYRSFGTYKSIGKQTNLPSIDVFKTYYKNVDPNKYLTINISYKKQMAY